MAAKGTVKRRSLDQENYVARMYNGQRSRSSGASDHDLGDVRTDDLLIECKMTGGPEQDYARELKGKDPQRSKLLKDMMKIWEEASGEGRDAIVCLREYAPEAPFANSDGYVDLTVRLLDTDVYASQVE